MRCHSHPFNRHHLSNTCYLMEGDKGIDRLVLVNDGVDDDLDGVGVGEEVDDLHGVFDDAD